MKNEILFEQLKKEFEKEKKEVINNIPVGKKIFYKVEFIKKTLFGKYRFLSCKEKQELCDILNGKAGYNER